MGYVYVLRCSDGSYYIGSTECFEKRWMAHINGRVKYTKGKLPVIPIFIKKFNSYKEAFIFENRIKSWKKRRSIETMIMKPDNIVRKFLTQPN